LLNSGKILELSDLTTTKVSLVYHLKQSTMNAVRKLQETEQLQLPLHKQRSKRSLTTMPQEHLDVNERFKHKRIELGETQREFSKRLDTSESTIKAIETGRVAPNIYLIKQFHRSTGASYNWLLDGEENPRMFQ
jgi:DNA-binding XRE family transcriptional regulator